MATWPATLPQQFSYTNYQETDPELVLRFQPDFGPSISRKRGTANSNPFSGSMDLTSTQKGILKQFWIDNCAVPFDFPEPGTGNLISVKFTAPNQYSGSGFFRDGEPLWPVKIQLEALP